MLFVIAVLLVTTLIIVVGVWGAVGNFFLVTLGIILFLIVLGYLSFGIDKVLGI